MTNVVPIETIDAGGSFANKRFHFGKSCDEYGRAGGVRSVSRLGLHLKKKSGGGGGGGGAHGAKRRSIKV